MDNPVERRAPKVSVGSSVAQRPRMGMQSLLFSAAFLFPILCGPAEVDAVRILSLAAKTLTRFKMRLDARLCPDRENDVVRNLRLNVMRIKKI